MDLKGISEQSQGFHFWVAILDHLGSISQKTPEILKKMLVSYMSGHKFLTECEIFDQCLHITFIYACEDGNDFLARLVGCEDLVINA